jgi:hypothetical protein
MKKRYVILISIALSIGIILFSLSSIVKWYVVKNSKELVGRQINIKELHFNYLRVSVSLKDFVMYEKTSADTFASSGELYINFDPWALLKKEYAFSEIRLTNPKIALIQNGEHFNFDDLIPTNDTVKIKKEKDTTATNIRFLLRNIKLTGGLISYTDKQIKNHMVMRNLDLEIPQIAWDSNQSDVGVSFRIGEHGVVKLDANLNNQKHFYSVTMDTRDLDLNMITNYLKSYLNISALQGNLTSNIILSGRLDTVTNLNIKGIASVDHLSMVDNTSASIFSAEKIVARIKNIDLAKFHFGFSNITTTNAKLLAILNKKKSNIMEFLEPYFISDSIAKHRINKTAPIPETHVTYSIDTILLKNSIVNFHDHTLNRPFAYDLKNISLKIIGLTDSGTNIPLTFNVGLNNIGELKGTYNLNMQNPYAFKTQFSISNMDLVSFSPYSEYYIASPITKGLFNYDISIEMSKTKLNNENKVTINQLEFGKRTHDKTAIKAPVRLALYILKDPHGKIAFDLPVKGNPSDPEFSLSKIIWKTVGNFCLKVASEPFKALAGLVSTKPEDIDKMTFEPAQDTLSSDNLQTVHLLAELARKKPDLKFMFVQYTNTELEKEKIATLLVKEQFIRTTKPTADSSAINDLVHKLSLTDNDFKTYLAANIAGGATMEPAKACVAIIGNTRLENELLQKINRRNWSLMKALGIYEKLPEELFRIETADLRNIPDELKTTMFKINVTLND